MSKLLYGTLGALSALGVSGAGMALALHAGLVNVRADTPHPPLASSLIEWARERSIQRESAEVAIPDNLRDAERVRRGAGNYAAMCATCHLAPGQEMSELRSGLNPQPPDLAQQGGARQPGDDDRIAARQFWIIKHGIAASGMPAWSKGGMEDDAIWNLVAFLRVLPTLSSEQYRQSVDASDGHSHAGASAHHTSAPATNQADSGAGKRPHAHTHAHDNHAH